MSLLMDARVLRADTGAEVAVGELVRSGERPFVWSFDDRTRMVRRPVSNVAAARTGEAFAVRLASGRLVEAGANATLLSLNGTTQLSGLTVGDRVAVPRRLPQPSTTEQMADDEIILLAHMIGDGSCIRNQPTRYASIDEQNLRAVANAAKHFGITAIRDEYAAARVTTLRLPAPYRVTHGRRNPVVAWLDELGLYDKRSYDKFVPDVVFATPNDQVALFLRHLWSTDGCVWWDAKQGLGRIYYGSTSRRLIDDVRQLLLRQGISSRAHRTHKAGYRDSWQLAVSGVSNQRRFLQTIDAHGMKWFAAREVALNLAAVQANENVDTVPREVWNHVREALSDKQMSHRAFAAAMQTKFCGSTMWKHSPSRGRLHRAAVVLEDRALHDLTKNDVFWDKVVEVTSIGEREVFDVEVAGGRNLVVNGVAVGDSATAGR